MIKRFIFLLSCSFLFFSHLLCAEEYNSELEKKYLKTARALPLDEAVKKYEDFLRKYPDSNFRLLARYELSNLYKIIENYDKALDQYRILLNVSKGTSYWQKSIINISMIEFKLGNYDKAKVELSKLINKIDDYEDNGKIYYLSGKIMFAKGMYKEAEKHFLICAGTYPQSSKGASSLLELVKIYILMGKYDEAERIKEMLNSLYPDSPEGYKVDDLLKKIKNNIENTNHLEIELINLNKEIDIKSSSLIFLDSELEKSLNENNKKDNSSISNAECNFYIQLGYLSTEENAANMVSEYKKKNVAEVYYTKTKSSDTSKVYYRVVLGPFSTKKSANNKLIDLKEKNIESIILELCKYYE